MRKILATLLSLAAATALQAQTELYDLRTEGLKDPVAIDAAAPRFSWKLRSSEQNTTQRSYRIKVATTPQLLGSKADVWDSGRVESDQSVWVESNCAALKSNSRYYWQVEVSDNHGAKAVSETATFGMGLSAEPQWGGQWIGNDQLYQWDCAGLHTRLSARYLRSEFESKKEVARATVHIAGLGLCELYINGTRVGNDVLSPVPSDYRKTIYYNSFDVTNLVKEKNAVGVILGNGRQFAMRQVKPYKVTTFGYPKLRFSMTIEYTDGTTQRVVSNDQWKLNADGAIRSNNEYDGELYDARKEWSDWSCYGFDDSQWENAKRTSLPTGTLRAQPTPNMAVMEQIKPLSINRKGDRLIVDMGQNMTGWLKIKIKGNKGDTITMRFAETLNPDSTLYVANLRDAEVTDRYIVSGTDMGREWSPTFVFHGFRYVELGGYGEATADDLTGEVIYDRMERRGTFACSDPTINTVYKNATWGIRGNYKGMPLDCPQRNERQPWLGDRAMGTYGESYTFDNDRLYSKWINDLCEAQRWDGSIPDVAPAFWNYYSDNMTWPSSLPVVSKMLYDSYGDTSPIVRSYPAVRKWLAYMRSNYMTDDYIVTKDTYGDWCVPPEKPELIHSEDPARITDGALLSTAYYYKLLQVMREFAALQQFTDDEREYALLGENIRKAFNDKYFDPQTGNYGNGTVTANLLPVAFEMVEEQNRDRVIDNIVKKIVDSDNLHISSGVIGMQWLMHTLCQMGRGDVAYKIASQQSYPSWGYMAQKGATTIWELWNGDTANPAMNSGNHVMLLGDLLKWIYEDVAGIAPAAAGFKRIRFAPDFSAEELRSAEAEIETPYGKVASSWKLSADNTLEWHIEVPANTTAEVILPATDKVIVRQGRRLKSEVREQKRLELGSGKYDISCRVEHLIGKDRTGVVSDEFVYLTAPFPQCHAATIAQTKGGDLLTSFFGGAYEGSPDVCIYTSRMAQGSTEWSAPTMVADGVVNDTLRKACYNPVLYQIPDGDLLLFYKVGSRVSDWTGYLIRSSDDGHTWSAPTTFKEGLLGAIKNKPEMIEGRIVAPSSTEVGGWKLHVEYSDDKGQTWYRGESIEAANAIMSQHDNSEGEVPQTNDKISSIQPTILRLSDGRLQMLARTRNYNIATTFSSDNGTTWSRLELMDNLPNNNSGIDAVTLRDGRHLLVYNNVPTPRGAGKGARTPLNVAISDNGTDWRMVATLEDSPIGQYSYPSVIESSDGLVHIVYTWRRERIKHVVIDPSQLK